MTGMMGSLPGGSVILGLIPDMGEHAAFIWTSYAIEVVVIAALIGWLVYDGRRQAAALADLDARGAGRRS